MKQRAVRVLSQSNLPAQFPLTLSIAIYLLLDKFTVPDWAWGVYWTVAVIWWLLVVYRLCTEEQVDIFSGGLRRFV